MGKKTGSVSQIRIRDDQHGSYFRELRNQFFGVQILKLFDVDPVSGMENIRIRPGSAARLCRIEISVGSALPVACFGFAFKIAL
jgi:hypothetical protein